MKQFFYCYLNLLAIAAAWVLSFGYGPFHPFAVSNDAGTQFGFAIGLTIALGLACALSTKFFPKYTATLGLSCAASGLGSLMSLMAMLLVETRSSHIGFGDGVMIFLVVTPIFAVLSAAFVASVKNIIFALFRGDFITVLFGLMIGFTAGMLAICLFALTAQLSIVITILMLLGLAGSAGGVKSETFDSSNYVAYDRNGNMHFVSSQITPSRITDTDGNTLRQNADNTWEKID